jgi:mannose-6-phosphate isomerase-like protein (cupin superfamily)
MVNSVKLEATGESITFTKTAADTNGEYLETLVMLPKNADGPPPHRHTLQTELFEAIEGQLRLMCDDEEVLLEPGETFLVPENSVHCFYSSAETDIKLKATFTPALNTQYMLSEIFASCNRRNSKTPSPFDASYVLGQAKGEYSLGDVPVFVQKFIFPVVAIVGKTLGLVKAKPLIRE